ncbi:DUF4129 domain-containing protein [Streptomyces reniochalinae]|uniref:DUF4129 domain-containing protein n=1 Tax=Streptomyces reniochalinae TaxID=2250578 RepID=A0A367F2Z8_9ACTN|nr:DUF4129 domain-containing protein [Streptomyces reniochalinae]RCG24641.1 DUF4129 domain-containing protein [Streptomyces reniochalinae]
MPGGITSGPSLHTAALRHPVGAAVHGEHDVPVTTPRLPAREDAERELSRPEYHQHDPPLYQRALDWLWHRLTDLLNTAAEATPGGWVGLLAVCLLIALLLISLRLRLGRLRPAPTTDPGALFTDHPRTAAEHRAAAESHAHAGNWNAAVQECMRGIVRSLEERALLDPRPGRTADEAAAEAGRALPHHATRLGAAAHTFDEVTYADRPADRTSYEDLRDLDAALLRTPPPPNPPAASSTPSPQGNTL